MNYIVHAVLALWTLTLTAPARDAARATPCPLGCRDTTTSSVPCADATTFEVWWQQQSPTWVMNRTAILASPAVRDSLWPTVVAEASYHLWGTRATTASEAGKACSVSLPDSLPTGRWWFVTTLDGHGNRSCMSNEVHR